MTLQMTEAEFQNAIVDYGHLRQWKFAHFRRSLSASGRHMTAVQYDAKGYPDLTAVRDGEVIWIEVKSAKGRLSPEQKQWLELLPNSFCWRPSDWPEIVRVLA